MDLTNPPSGYIVVNDSDNPINVRPGDQWPKNLCTGTVGLNSYSTPYVVVESVCTTGSADNIVNNGSYRCTDSQGNWGLPCANTTMVGP